MWREGLYWAAIDVCIEESPEDPNWGSGVSSSPAKLDLRGKVKKVLD